MDIENLIKLLSFFNNENKSINKATNDSLFNDYIGKYVIVRTRNEGINAGYLKKADETGCVLQDARRIYYHEQD